MANVTLVIDDDLLRAARVKAARTGTSVNAVLRRQLSAWVAADDAQADAVDALLDLAERHRGAWPAERWTRDELHDR